MPDTSQQHLSAQTLQPGFLSGQVVHHRFSPKEHRFTNRMYWHLVNTHDLDAWSQQSVFRSHNGLNLYGFKDQDYVSKEKQSIQSKIVAFINQQSDEEFNGEILLMSHPRYLNVGFNSVNFYFCYRHQQLHYIVSEINNTPWGEKQLYFHDCRQQSLNESGQHDFNFDKSFHISPFVSMNIKYQWRFKVYAEGVDVHMKLLKDDSAIMYVGMQTQWQPVNCGITVKRPAQAWKMWLNIYYQAARLWLKKVPFHNHPKPE